MTLADQIAWLDSEAIKRLAAAGRREKRAAEDRSRAGFSGPSWYAENAARKEQQGQKPREEAAHLLAVENSLRELQQLRSGQ